MSLVSEQAAFLLDVTKLINFATDEGWVVTGGELWRTLEQQALHLKNGKSKTMASQHLKRLAIDLNFFWQGKVIWDAGLIKPIGVYWESLNPRNKWGGHFKTFVDAPHFERQY